MTIIVNDTFTDTDNVGITAHTGETGATWAEHSSNNNTGEPKVLSNKLVTTENDKNENYYASGTPGGADYTVTLDYLFNGNGANEICGPAARMSTSANTGYFFIAFKGVVGFRLYKYNAGTLTALGSLVSLAVSSGETYRMTIDVAGTAIAGRVQRLSDSQWLTSAGAWQAGQVNCASATDSAISAAGKAGFWFATDTTGGGTRGNIDNFTLNDGATDTTPPTLSSPTGTGGALVCSGSVSTNEAGGTLYSVATASATAPSAAQVKAGQDHTGAAALRVVSQAVSGTGVQTVASGSVTAGTRYLHFMHEDAAANQSTVSSSSSFTVTTDTTAPILSSAAGTGGANVCSGSVSTNEGNGTLYAVVTASATAPSAAQVKAGQDHGGSAALRVVSQSVSGAGSQSIASGSVTTGTRYFHYMHEDAAANQSTVASSASFTVTSGPVTIAVTDSNWKWSPYNWATVSSQKVAVNGGAYFKLGFTGTAVSIALDVSSLVSGSVSAGNYPSLRYSVDNGAQTDVQLTSSSTALAVTGLVSGTHSIEVWYVSGYWEHSGTDRWTTPVYCIKVGAATLDAGAASSAPTWYTNSLIFFGDSIGEGIRANYSTTQPACQNAYDSMPVYLARALECELGNVSFGGLNYNSGYGSIPSFLSGYGSVYSGQSRLTAGALTPDPAYACIWYGANGAPSQANVESAIGILRTIAPTALVCVIVPIGGYGRTNITAAVAAYKAANASERRVHLIDLGSAWQTGLDAFGSATQQAIDGLHPRANWNARIGAAYAARIASLRALTTTTKTVSLTLTTDGSTAAASLTGLKWAWWDQITPDVMASPPADYGVAETTDGSGVLTITVRSTLSAAGVGWLVVTNSDGTTSQSPAHKLFAGPVAVS